MSDLFNPTVFGPPANGDAATEVGCDCAFGCGCGCGSHTGGGHGTAEKER